MLYTHVLSVLHPLLTSQCSDPYVMVDRNVSREIVCSLDSDGDGIPDEQVSVCVYIICNILVHVQYKCMYLTPGQLCESLQSRQHV